MINEIMNICVCVLGGVLLLPLFLLFPIVENLPLPVKQMLSLYT